MNKRLNLIQYFTDGGEERDNDNFSDMSTYFADGQFDLDKFQSDYESTLDKELETSEEETEVEETTETETEVEETDESETEVEESEPETEEQTKDEVKFSTEKQNKAFAEMRRQLQEKEKYEKFLGSLASKRGMTPDQLMDALQEKMIEDEAKAQGVPVDVYKRLNELERENSETKKQSFAQKFNQDVATTKEKYALDEKAIDNVFVWMHQNEFVDEDGMAKIGFEQAYILANKDNLLKQAEERGKQAYLESKRQRQEGAEVPVKGDTTKTETTDYSEEDVFKYLSEHDIQF